MLYKKGSPFFPGNTYLNKCSGRFILSLVTIFACCKSIAAPPSATQDAIAFDTSRYWSLAAGQGEFGWQFTTQTNIQVSALGIFDNAGIFPGGFPGDGLMEAHAIGIWDIANHSTPLITALLSAGTSASLINGFRWTSINPTLLTAGHTYVIVAEYPNPASPVDALHNKDFTTGDYYGVVPTAGEGISIGGYWSSSSTTLSFPNIYVSDHQYGYGPNFNYSIVPVPEPSIATLAVVSSIMWFKAKRRRT